MSLSPDLKIHGFSQAYLREKVPLFLFVLCSTCIFMFFLFSWFPINYLVQSEYLLKKKTLSGLEAIAVSQKAESSSHESLTIEPFFYSTNIFEKAVVESAYQIVESYPGPLARIVDNLFLVYLALDKQEPKETFVFKNCVFNLPKKIEFSLRRLGDHHFELLFRGVKTLHEMGEKILFKELSFEIEKFPKEQFRWYSYKVQPLQKRILHARSHLKIRPEKNSKASLFLQFFCFKKNLGEKFLDSFVKFAELEAERIKQKSIDDEILVLKQKILQLEGVLLSPKLKEELNFLNLEIHHLKERNYQIQNQRIELSQLLKKIENLLISQLVSEEFSAKEFLLVQKKVEFLDETRVYQKNAYAQFSLEFLERALFESKTLLKNYEATINKLNWVNSHRSSSSWIVVDFSKVLTELFIKKRGLESFGKNKAVSEIQENLAQIKEIDHLIEIEIEFTRKEVQEKIEQELESQNLINCAIGYVVLKERDYLKEEYFKNLRYKSQEINSKLKDLEKESTWLVKSLDEKIQNYTEKALEIEKFRKRESIKEELESKLFKKEIEQKTKYFFGTTIYSAKGSDFPNFALRFFLVFVVSLLFTISYMCLLFIRAFNKGVFPCREFFFKVGVKQLKMSDFKKSKGRNLYVTNKLILPFSLRNIAVKKMKDFQECDFSIYSHVGFDQNVLTLEQIERYLKNSASFYSINSDIF